MIYKLMTSTGGMMRICLVAAFAIVTSCSDPIAAATIIEAVEFKETSLSEAVEFFRAKGNGLNFVIDSKVDSSATVTLQLRNVTLGAAVFCLAESMNLDFRMEPHACFIVPAGSGTIAVTAPSPLNSQSQFHPARVAESRRVGEIVFDETPLREVGELLSFAGTNESSPLEHLNIVIQGRIDPTLPIQLNMRNTSVAHVLGSVAEITGLEIRVEPFAIFVDPPGTRLERIRQNRIATRANSVKPKPKPKRPPVGTTSVLWQPSKDPRKKDHPDYDDRMLKPNMIFKWIDGKFTYVRYVTDAEKSNLIENPRRVFDPVELEPIEPECE